MKVMIVNRYMGLYGGAETVVKELAVRLNERGIHPLVVTLNLSEQVRALCAGIEVITPPKFFPYKFRSMSIASSLGIIDEMYWLRKLIKRHAPRCDLINAHNFPAEWVAGGLGKPVVWMCNEVPDFYNNPRPSPAVRLLRLVGIGVDRCVVRAVVDRICVADDFNARQAVKRYATAPVVIPYGINYDFFSNSDGRDAARAEYSLDGRFVLLQVGMISPEKNQMKSIEAVEAVRGEIPNIKLVLAGRPQNPYDQMLKEYVSRRNLHESVVFTGHITKEKVRALYHACDAALFPVKTQGGWLSPFEAISAGKPVVVSPTMGAAAVIEQAHLGSVSDDLAGTVREMYSRYALYASRAGQARQWVKDNLTWEKFTDAMVAVFEETIRKK